MKTTKSDILVYSYLVVLLICSLVYGVFVIKYSGVDKPPVLVNVELQPDILQNQTAYDALVSQFARINDTTSRLTVNVWWSVVESTPAVYNWQAYRDLFQMISSNLTGSRVRVSLNFHACMDDTFCAYDIPLPNWVTALNTTNPEVFYTDVNNHISFEYLTCGVDHVAVLPPYNRTGIEVYSQFMLSFADTFRDLFDSLIYEVDISLGPSGELRYPSFPRGLWQMPGIGQFQCYDKYLTTEYLTYAQKLHPKWAYFPTASQLSYNDAPDDATFFNDKNKMNGTASDYGKFFLEWYSGRLIQHGNAVLAQASSIFKIYSPNITISTALGCIYWQSGDSSHAAEITAGYLNYTSFATMLASYNVKTEFGCFDLNDRQVSKGLVHPHAAPQQLIAAMLQTANSAGLKIEGTNTKMSFEEDDVNQIKENVAHDSPALVGFNFRYLSDGLISNLDRFRSLVDSLTKHRK